MNKTLDYCVQLTAWDAMEIWIEASSEDQAIELALDKWNLGHDDAFKHRSCGVDDIGIKSTQEIL